MPCWFSFLSQASRSAATSSGISSGCNLPHRRQDAGDLLGRHRAVVIGDIGADREDDLRTIGEVFGRGDFDSSVVDHGTNGGHGCCSFPSWTTRPATTPNSVPSGVEPHDQAMWRVGISIILPDRMPAGARRSRPASSSARRKRSRGGDSCGFLFSRFTRPRESPCRPGPDRSIGRRRRRDGRSGRGWRPSRGPGRAGRGARVGVRPPDPAGGSGRIGRAAAGARVRPPGAYTTETHIAVLLRVQTGRESRRNFTAADRAWTASGVGRSLST